MRRIRAKGAQPRQPMYAGVAGVLARAVDATIGIVLPGVVQRMRKARIQNAAMVAFEAAQITRTSPKATSASADGEILPDIRQLRDLSRQLERDDAHASSTINILDEVIVGEGIIPQSVCTPEATKLTPDACKLWRESCDAEFYRWAENEADATEVGTFYDLQSLALRCFLLDGDAIGHAVIGGDAMIACELIDADRVESPGYFDTETIRAGVELGPHGEQVAFWILPKHPDDWFPGARAKDQTTPVRHAANDNGISIVQHVFKRKRPGQTRGIPVMTASLLYTRHLHHYLDSEVIGARAASNFALFIKRAVTPVDADIMPVADAEGTAEGPPQGFLEDLHPGTIEYLNEGEEPVPFNPNRPGSNFEPFVVRMLRATAASCGLSYELVCRDFGRMNLSSARAMLAECRRGFDTMRRRLVRQFCAPWWNNVIRMAIASGRLRAPAGFIENPEAFLAARWVAPSYVMVDPETDVAASSAAVAANLSDPYEEAAKQGRDAEQILRARARFIRRAMEIAREEGIPEDSLLAPVTNQPSPPANAPDEEGEEEETEPVEEEQPA